MSDERLSLVKRLRTMSGIGWHPIGDEAADEIERLREALGYYANKENYRNTISLGHPQIDGSTSHIKLDNGAKARSALQQKDTE